jgi:hypothetical protein
MKTLDDLIHERHEAFQRAAATDFHSFGAEWRAANQAYVAARDAATSGDSIAHDKVQSGVAA